MTYRQLRNYINAMNDDRLGDDVTVCIDNSEYFRCGGMGIADYGVLDDGHYFINVDTIGVAY